MNTDKYHVIRVGETVDLLGTPIDKVVSRSITADPFSGDDPRVKYEQVLKPVIDLLPLGLKDLNYFIMYHVDGTWVVFDIERLPEPRTWEDLEIATGLTLRETA